MMVSSDPSGITSRAGSRKGNVPVRLSGGVSGFSKPSQVPVAGRYAGRLAPGLGIVVVVVVVTGGAVGAVTRWKPEGMVRMDRITPTPTTVAAITQGLTGGRCAVDSETGAVRAGVSGCTSSISGGEPSVLSGSLAGVQAGRPHAGQLLPATGLSQWKQYPIGHRVRRAWSMCRRVPAAAGDFSGNTSGRCVVDGSMSAGPNLLAVAWSIAKAKRVRTPGPFGSGRADHRALRSILEAVEQGRTPALIKQRRALDAYLDALRGVDADALTRGEALAYWINLYNAGALRLAAEAVETQENSVLRVPGGFSRPFVEVSGEALSLDVIEHGKIRRFGDPRIHGALVCGSVSCPTLRAEPYDGDGVERQLEDQMKQFLGGGAAAAVGDKLLLSRMFLWYGGDFTRPARMPTWLPAGGSALKRALVRWLPEELALWVSQADPKLEFQSYDWGLRCAVGSV
ncbi:MAG TPA: DUF547 domain-containing protein [Actinobacteria bacterium]|nr:DUF547 domain-containing protein [Actinomycetota bacterium]